MVAKKRAPKSTSTRAPEPKVPPRVVGSGGRKTSDTTGIGFFGTMTIVPPPDPAGNWRALDLDAKTLGRISINQLAEYLVDLSPEVSKALFDFLREVNPGYDLVAYQPGTREVDQRAQVALDAFVATLNDRSGCIFDVTISRLFMGMFLRGAFLAELVLDEAGRMPVDLATPDPWLVRWRREPDPVLGTRLILCQWQSGKLVDLDAPTIRYVPVDPLPSSPYGRPLVAPALFVALFMLAVMHDLRRVIQQQGYPRHYISIDLKQIVESMSGEVQSSAELFALADQIRQQVETYIATLEPDDTFVATSMVKVEKPVGAVDTASMGGISAAIDWLERSAVRALKTSPFQMAMSQSQTETQANRQFESHMLGVKTLQHYAETPLSRLFTLALQAQGIIADVEMRFSVNRSAERLRDAQTDQIEIANNRTRYDNGWISQDEAAKGGAGKDKSDQPEPRTSSAPAQPVASGNPEPGVNRTRTQRRSASAKLVPLGADAPFDDLPEHVTFTAAEKRDLSAIWDETQDSKYADILEAELVNGSGE